MSFCKPKLSGVDIGSIRAIDVFKELTIKNMGISKRTVEIVVKEFKASGICGGSNSTINGDTDSTINSTIKFIQDNRQILEQMISIFSSNTTTNSTINTTNILPVVNYSKAEGFKDYKYNLSVELHRKFEEHCKALGLSQRKGLHMALMLFNNLCLNLTKGGNG